MRLHLATAALCALGLHVMIAAQGPPTGFRLYGPLGGTDTHLVDASGTVVHTWRSTFRPGLGVHLLPDGSLLRTIRTRMTPGMTPGSGGGVQRLAFDGTVLWDYRYDGPGVMSHHDIEPMPNGNVLLIAWEDRTPAEAIAAGRDPALITGPVFRPDHIVEVQPTGPTSGTIVWRWHVWDHLVQDFDPAQANFGVVADHPELVDINYPGDPASSPDWNHFNGIDYDPIHDWVVLSAHRQNEIWIIDHATTTAEAAGHTGGAHGNGGDLIYRWGNPAAYDRGTTVQQMLFGQHAPRFIPPGYPGEGNLLFFNNRLPGGSAAQEIVLPIDASGRFVTPPTGSFGPAAPVWSARAPATSIIVSNAQRLANGNTLICAGQPGRIDIVDPSGAPVWTHFTNTEVFHAHDVQRTLWTDAETLSLTTGGAVTFDLVAGGSQAARPYLVLGSASGTSPGVVLRGQRVPLNVDGYFMTTLSLPGVAPFIATLGLLDARGRAQAGFALPPGLVALAGLHLDHAYVVLDAATVTVRHASNAVPLDLVQ